MLDIEIVDNPAPELLSAERVKDFLEIIYNKTPFKIVYSSDKPNGYIGLYKYLTNEIILYPRHYNSNYDLMKTAIHELAHHIDYIKHGRRQKPHTGSFKKILAHAEKLAIENQILEENNNSDLDIVLNKAVDFGESIINFIKNNNDHHKMDELQKTLYGASKRSIMHFCKVRNTVKNKSMIQ